MRGGISLWCAVVMGCAGLVLAGGSEQWRQAGPGTFDKAELDGTVVDSLGWVRLAHALKPLAKPGKTPFVWSLALDHRGRLLVGTGNEGRIFALDLKSGKASLLYDSDELEILSLVVADDGTVFAGSGPKGRIFRITTEGKVDLYYRTGAAYVWALAVDGKGTLYAATGPEGKIYRITGPGVGRVLYDSPQTHILSLAVDGRGRIYAGSDREGLIYRITPAEAGGRVFVVYDAPQPEVRALLVEDDGTIYAATTGGTGSRASSGGTSGPRTPSRTVTRPRGTAPRGPRPSGSAAVYRIDPTGVVQLLFQPPRGGVFAIARRNRQLLVATGGEEGRIYQVDLDHPDRTAMLAKVKAKQVLTLLTAPDGTCYLGTANPGEVHRLGVGRVRSGTLVSEVLDARFAALWGRIRWRGTLPTGTDLVLACRSGNVAEPDDTWSPWRDCKPIRVEANGCRSAPIDAPSARYLQYRLTLRTSDPRRTPVVKEVTVSYLPANQAPEVSAVKVALPTTPARGSAKGKGGARPQRSSSGPPTGKLKITWRARDPNGDPLKFSLFFRGEDESLWKQLAKGLTKPEYVWDVEAVPDGRYRLKVVASDAPSNSPERALSGWRVSDVVVVDRTAPVVEVLDVMELGAGSRQVRLRALDPKPAASDIISASFSLDGGDWTPLLPTDKVFDGSEEEFLVDLRGLTPGEHTFVLRATDAVGNVGAGKVVIRVK